MKLSKFVLVFFIAFSPVLLGQYEFEWASSYGSTDNDLSYAIATDTAGNVYTAGRFYGTVDFDPTANVFNLTSNGGSEGFVQKFDANGVFEWAIQIGGGHHDEAQSIAVDKSGNIYVVGNFWLTVDFDPGVGVHNLVASGGDDGFILKLNPDGHFIWAKQIGAGLYDEISVVDTDDLGNVYFGGEFRNTVDFDPGPGVENHSAVGGYDIFIEKMDSTGVFSWVKTFGGGSTDLIRSMQLDDTGNILSSGGFIGTGDFDPGPGVEMLTSLGDYDMFIQKLDPSGNFLWVRQMGNTSQDFAQSITVDHLGNVITTGEFRETVDFDPGVGVLNFTASGTRDMYIQKLDPSGNLLWAQQYGSTESDMGYGITTDDYGNIYSTGSFGETLDFDPGAGIENLSVTGSSDFYVLKQNSNGDLVWVERFGGSGSEYGQAITIDVNENIVSAGRIYSTSTFDFDFGPGVTNLTSNGISDVVVFKLSPCITAMETDVHVACDSYTWIDGVTYTASNNTASMVYSDPYGCDSIVTLDLTINYSDTWTDVQVACDSFIWIDGNTYTSSNNTATVSLMNTVGCDSIITLDLTILNSSASTDYHMACDSYTWIDGITYTSPNTTSTWTLLNAAGCDSVVTLDLALGYSNTGIDVQVACESYTWVDGVTYTVSNNTAQWIATNASGCDSLVTLDLTILDGSSGADVQTACDSYTWMDGNTYTASNNSAQWIIPNTVGCDSLVTLDLTILNSTGSTDIQEACGSYVWIDGNEYTSSNNSATYILSNAIGCDSIITLDLTIHPMPNLSVTQTGGVLSSDEAGANYQWLDCGDNYSIIPGATNQSYTPAQIIGDYAVEIDLDGCIDTTTCYLVDYTGLDEVFTDVISIQPNPTTEKLKISGLDQLTGLKQFEVLTSKGELLSKYQVGTTELNVAQYSTGVYILKIVHQNGVELIRFVKE